ncbi:hypothetical protein [Zavarzinia sp.]|uniref:hypothetical protein n=1 Tax=Zavarzinia sp. TaxID=2027920 RepID=UPI003BB6C9EF
MRFAKPFIVAALAAALVAPAASALARGWDDDHRGGGYSRDRDDHRGPDWREGGRHHDDRRDHGRRDWHDERTYSRGYGNGYDRGYDRGYDDAARFADRDRQRMRGWWQRYPSHYRPLPRGYYYQPPMRGAYLPRGYYVLPPVIVRDMRPLPPGYGYYAVGSDIVIAAVATGLILDVILGGR